MYAPTPATRGKIADLVQDAIDHNRSYYKQCMEAAEFHEREAAHYREFAVRYHDIALSLEAQLLAIAPIEEAES